MTRPDLDTVPPYYRRYVEQVADMDLLDALRQSGKQMQELLASVPEEKGDFAYAPEKWTLREVINHVMDTERIFAYRALRFARNDQTPLASFEEKGYASHSNAAGRTVRQLAAELQRLRDTTLDLFESFTPEMLKREGTASNQKMSVLHLGYFIAGHDIHHRRILEDRYLNR